jgi:uncharacterized protein YxjI
MTPIFPIIELVDRYAIALLKHNKTQANLEELTFYKNQLSDYDLTEIELELQNLYQIHSQIWQLESDLKSGRENQVPLEEIGRRAIEIRDWNHKRITLKNTMAEKLECKIREIKHDHLSQSDLLKFSSSIKY